MKGGGLLNDGEVLAAWVEGDEGVGVVFVGRGRGVCEVGVKFFVAWGRGVIGLFDGYSCPINSTDSIASGKTDENTST